MRSAQQCWILFVAACTATITTFSLCARNGEQSRMRPTFEYKESKSLTELTNSIREVRQRLEGAETRFGPMNTNVANLLSQLAGLYDDFGDYAQAQGLNLRCLSIREAYLGLEHLDVAEVLNDLAWDYRELGDRHQARFLFERSLSLTEKLGGSENFKAATTLNNLADLYRQDGDYARALSLCQRALSVRQRVLCNDHPDLIDSLVTLVQIIRPLGKLEEALMACQRSLAIAEKRLEPDHPLLADTLFVMGGVYSDMGRYPEALSALQGTLELDRRISSPDHPDVIEVLNELAILFARQLRWDQSLATSVEVSRRQGRYFIGQTLALSDLDALRFLERFLQSVELFHSICGQGAAAGLEAARRTGAEGLALSKAFLEEIRAGQAAFDVNPTTRIRTLREHYRALQVQLDRLPKSGVEAGQRDSRRQELQGELSAVEQQLSERSVLLAQTFRDRTLTLNDIARSLPPQAALVDFVEYRRFDFNTRGTGQWKERRYAAYLTFAPGENSTNLVAERVDLGEAAPINDAIERICRRVSAGQYAARDLKPALQQLSQLVYGPLAKDLAKVSHLIVCPDGGLSRVPFEMLSCSGRFLIEEKTISYVGSGREVARLARGGQRLASSAPVVFGDPDFDIDLAGIRRREKAIAKTDAPDSAASAGRHLSAAGSTNMSTLAALLDQLTAARRKPWLSRSYRGRSFARLPGAALEARSIAGLLGTNTTLRLGPDARERDLKAVASPRVLHLATHGFVLSDQELRRAGPTQALWKQTHSALNPVGSDWESPLIRCGVALAGANHALGVGQTAEEDGLLTGLEATLLNLQGTELVILSACDTSGGELKTGEGVMSLRRAFRIAGAQSVLASHWPINDKATTLLMTNFIRRWRAGQPRAEALRQAQLALLHSEDYASPYFWAAFTLTGQWR